FDRYGLLYERKRGEFADGILNGYIPQESVLERNLFFRMYYSSNGYITKAREKKLFIRQSLSFEELTKGVRLDNAYFGYLCFKRIYTSRSSYQRVDLSTYAKVYAMTLLFKPKRIADYETASSISLRDFESKWQMFIEMNKNKVENTITKVNKRTGEVKMI